MVEIMAAEMTPEHEVLETRKYYFYYCHECRSEWYSRKYEPKKPCVCCKADNVCVRDK
jgi:hypothetical protein